jgi:hypothetical protein
MQPPNDGGHCQFSVQHGCASDAVLRKSYAIAMSLNTTRSPYIYRTTTKGCCQGEVMLTAVAAGSAGICTVTVTCHCNRQSVVLAESGQFLLQLLQHHSNVVTVTGHGIRDL